ncbi:MAG: hypothetical protein PVJ04_12000 [Gemmatimonadota bacterium]|jgi:hypothetical protein
MPDTPPSPEPSGALPGSETGVDTTLGGYLAYHNRPPAFQGTDGHPYTVSMEVEQTPNLLAPFSGYLVFPRWAETGVGIVGHLETPVLLEEASRGQAEASLGALTLMEVQALLEDAIQRQRQEND